MNRAVSRIGVAFIMVACVVLTGCKKDDPQPVQAEVKAKLLAGDAGSSKAWKLVTVTEKQGSGAEQTLTLPGCAADNIYTFSNNASQDYEESEGATKCDSSDGSSVEKGTWAFTLDGTLLVILNTQISTSQTAFSFTQYFPYPSKVTELSDSILKLQMSYSVDGVSYVDTFTFNKN